MGFAGFGDIGFDFDVDFGAFDFEGAEADPLETQVWSRPVVRRPQACGYEHALDLAEALPIDNETETFAFVSGNFVFGDLLEALVDARRLGVRRLGIQTLSMSDENIDSLRNVCEMQPVEELLLVLSDYWYAHECHKGGAGALPVRRARPRRARPARGVRRGALQGRDGGDAEGQPPHDAGQRQPPQLGQRGAGAHLARPGAVGVLRRHDAEDRGRVRRRQPGQQEEEEEREEVRTMASGSEGGGGGRRGQGSGNGGSARERRAQRQQRAEAERVARREGRWDDVYGEMPF